MAVDPFTATEEAANIAAGLVPGRYLAQVRGARGERGVLYATDEAAPSSDDAFYQAYGGDAFVFWAPGEAPTWVKSWTGLAATVARSRIGDD